RNQREPGFADSQDGAGKDGDRAPVGRDPFQWRVLKKLIAEAERGPLITASPNGSRIPVKLQGRCPTQVCRRPARSAPLSKPMAPAPAQTQLRQAPACTSRPEPADSNRPRPRCSITRARPTIPAPTPARL